MFMPNNLIQLGLVGLLCVGLVGCAKENTEQLAILSVELRAIHDNWVANGRPSAFSPSTVVKSSTEQFSSYTNVVYLDGKNYHCRFAGRSSLLRSQGSLVLTDEGQFIWMDDKNHTASICYP